MKISILTPEYVELLPPLIQDGRLYISKKYGAAVHRCCCGCGTKIVTPLKPTEWVLTATGGKVSLWPSVGNFNHTCRSHYVIRNNRVFDAGHMSAITIAHGRTRVDANKRAYSLQLEQDSIQQGKLSLLKKIIRWFAKIIR